MPPKPPEMTRRERKAARPRVPKQLRQKVGLAGKQVEKAAGGAGRSKGAMKRAVNKGSR